MSTLIMSTDVAAPIEKVFEVYSDLAKLVERIPGITALEILSEGPFGEGTRWRETRLMFKKEAVEEMWVTGFKPSESYTVEAQSHGMLYQTLYEFTPEGDGTKVSWTFKGTPQTFGAKLTAPIFGLLFTGVMKKCMQGDLEALRDVCEGKRVGSA